MKLRFRTLSLQLKDPWQTARTNRTSVIEVVQVVLEDGDGLVGRGEATPVVRYGETAVKVESFLRQIEPNSLHVNDIVSTNAYLDAVPQGCDPAKAALNLALLDLSCKRANIELHDFLDLPFLDRKYLTSFTIGIDHPEVIRKKVLAAFQYPVLKMKVGAPGDTECLRALRDVAPDKLLRVDANEGWRTKESALAAIEQLARDPHLEFIEQPMPAAAVVDDCVWLKERSPLPIFADESYHTAADAEVAAECFHGVNVKLVKAGGITGAFDALQAARKLGLKTMIGCMIETTLPVSAAAHLASLADFLDLDGNLLIAEDPYRGVTADNGLLSFADAPESFGLRVSLRDGVGSSNA